MQGEASLKTALGALGECAGTKEQNGRTGVKGTDARVVQRYLVDQLLLQQRKFDIRHYMLSKYALCVCICGMLCAVEKWHTLPLILLLLISLSFSPPPSLVFSTILFIYVCLFVCLIFFSFSCEHSALSRVSSLWVSASLHCALQRVVLFQCNR